VYLEIMKITLKILKNITMQAFRLISPYSRRTAATRSPMVTLTLQFAAAGFMRLRLVQNIITKMW
jgi:hypothetical protein